MPTFPASERGFAVPSTDVRRPEPLGAALERLSNGVTTLVRDHLELARVELKEGARALGQDALVLGAGLGLTLVAHALLMVALSLLLAKVMPGWLAFGLVGGANLGVGGVLVARRLKAIQKRRAQASGVNVLA